jgi:alanine racemase
MKDPTPAPDPLTEPMLDDPSLLPSVTPPSSLRSTWARIDLANLIHNYNLLKLEVGPNVAIMPAVKADAYGHGAVACAKALADAGAAWFGVARPEEGVQLRDAGITKPILCLAGFREGQEELLIKNELTPALFRLDLLRRLGHAADRRGAVVNYHLHVDTGMGRLGLPARDLGGFLDESSRFVNVVLDGVMSHFASADDPARADFTNEQMRLFEEVLGEVSRRGHNPRWVHQANGSGAMAYPAARRNMVRPGGILYGLWRDVTNTTLPQPAWRPVMSLHSRIIQLKTVPAGTPLGYGGTYVTERETRVATLPIGYNDGLRRGLSNRGHVLVHGKPAPIIGRISMDLTLVDVSGAADSCLGDEVVLIGRQGEAEITAEDVAGRLGTISYEVTCGVSARVPRVQVEHG